MGGQGYKPGATVPVPLRCVTSVEIQGFRQFKGSRRNPKKKGGARATYTQCRSQSHADQPVKMGLKKRDFRDFYDFQHRALLLMAVANAGGYARALRP